MAIAFVRVQSLLKSISTAVPDSLNCDGCFELIAQFAEAELQGVELNDLLEAVRIHLSQCPCCAYEYESLLEAIQAADADD